MHRIGTEKPDALLILYRDSAENQSLESVADFLSDYTGTDASVFLVHEVDKELRINGSLRSAVYVYEIEFFSDTGIEYTVEVS